MPSSGSEKKGGPVSGSLRSRIIWIAQAACRAEEFTFGPILVSPQSQETASCRSKIGIHRYPKWILGKWKQGLKPAVPFKCVFSTHSQPVISDHFDASYFMSGARSKGRPLEPTHDGKANEEPLEHHSPRRVCPPENPRDGP